MMNAFTERDRSLLELVAVDLDERWHSVESRRVAATIRALVAADDVIASEKAAIAALEFTRDDLRTVARIPQEELGGQSPTAVAEAVALLRRRRLEAQAAHRAQSWPFNREVWVEHDTDLLAAMAMPSMSGGGTGWDLSDGNTTAATGIPWHQAETVEMIVSKLTHWLTQHPTTFDADR